MGFFDKLRSVFGGDSSAQAEGVAYLEKNRKCEGVKEQSSGLQYRVLAEGSGASPNASDSVKVHYEGRFISGEVFDSSYARGEPITFALSGVIAGWTEALQLMNKGARYELVIPYGLAYGKKGAPPRIPPYSTLVFTVELLDIT